VASLIKRNRLSVTVTIFLAKTLAGCSDQSPSAHRFRSASVQGTRVKLRSDWQTACGVELGERLVQVSFIAVLVEE